MDKKEFLKKYDCEFSVQDAIDEKQKEMTTDLDQLINSTKKECVKIVTICNDCGNELFTICRHCSQEATQ